MPAPSRPALPSGYGSGRKRPPERADDKPRVAGQVSVCDPARVSEQLPAALRGPVDLALARAVDKLPGPHALPGGSVFEPKWDGYRAIVTRDGQTTTVWSRQGKDLTRYFPDLYAVAATAVPPGCVLDGEIVAWVADRLDFTSLQRRMTSSRRTMADLIRREPVSYVAFDLLAVAGHDIRDRPLRERRNLLEELAGGWEPPMQISPATTDHAQARRWFDELHVTGIEGLLIKGAGQRYEGGRRQWQKYKHRDTLDAVLAAVIGPRHQPRELVIGLPINQELPIVGRTVPLRPTTARELGKFLHEPAGEHPWPQVVRSATVAGWGNPQDINLTLVEPIVIEVLADVAWSGTSFRHPVRYARVRPELDPRDITLPDRLTGP
jgi:ATP-dependent DNA ligase